MRVCTCGRCLPRYFPIYPVGAARVSKICVVKIVREMPWKAGCYRSARFPRRSLAAARDLRQCEQIIPRKQDIEFIQTWTTVQTNNSLPHSVVRTVRSNNRNISLLRKIKYLLNVTWAIYRNDSSIFLIKTTLTPNRFCRYSPIVSICIDRLPSTENFLVLLAIAKIASKDDRPSTFTFGVERNFVNGRFRKEQKLLR